MLCVFAHRSQVRSSASTTTQLDPIFAHIIAKRYDAIILETFTLKKHYDNLRQELAHALYANDASARVIARLMNERDQAREALASIQGTIGAGPSRAAQDVEMSDSAPAENGASAEASGSGLSADVLNIVDSTAKQLSSQRKAKSKRKAPEGYATQATVADFTEVQNLPSMHHAKPAAFLASLFQQMATSS